MTWQVADVLLLAATNETCWRAAKMPRRVEWFLFLYHLPGVPTPRVSDTASASVAVYVSLCSQTFVHFCSEPDLSQT